MVQVLIYWIGNIGIVGKGPNWIENYTPTKTLGEITRTLTKNGLGERNKTIKIFKHKCGSMNYDANDPHWADSTVLSDYINYYGGLKSQYIEMIYVIV